MSNTLWKFPLTVNHSKFLHSVVFKNSKIHGSD